MAVPISTTGQTATPGTPTPLFLAPAGSEEFTVSPDGQRFLISRVVEDALPITMLLNWKP
jgi:hypothetical protein